MNQTYIIQSSNNIFNLDLKDRNIQEVPHIDGTSKATSPKNKTPHKKQKKVIMMLKYATKKRQQQIITAPKHCILNCSFKFPGVHTQAANTSPKNIAAVNYQTHPKKKSRGTNQIAIHI